ncbi:metallopeptidase family protein [Anoxybacterium hadale]|uniref:Metallopeptidase family protein n=1 Tax=Anoxybacterium hadale TaxID=3408580 RepID=A0ACD1A844_9FIRM|nr:metallopeptidase family protein [Clostridiales bacterium]
MITIEEMEQILEELAEELPAEFYRELNGGILLLPETKISPEAKKNDLYTMGQYRYNPSMGRYIVIYYGSFEALYAALPTENLKQKLREVLRHEFTHHLEDLAGERDLEKEDEAELERYRYGLPMKPIRRL